LVDGDWLKEILWQFNEEEEVDFYILAAGIDSEYFMYTFGLPLYISTACVILSLLLLVIN
jgi:hypothetical protein